MGVKTHCAQKPHETSIPIIQTACKWCDAQWPKKGPDPDLHTLTRIPAKKGNLNPRQRRRIQEPRHAQSLNHDWYSLRLVTGSLASEKAKEVATRNDAKVASSDPQAWD
eukprot:symbB.v1.2.020476.t1/scaffold1729.1/size181395/13